MQSTTAQLRELDPFDLQHWLGLHESFLARKSAGPIDLLFLGDSITQGWNEEGKAIWKKEYAPLNAANFGIGGDETQHVLWRIHHGEIDGISPRALVLKIGTNNIGNSRHDAEQTIAGIVKVVAELRDRLPRTRILLLGLFPRDEQPGTAHRQSIQSINDAISRLDQGDDAVTYLDLTDKLLLPDGRISREIMPDFLHLSEKGYQIWADQMRPTLQKLMRP